MNVNVKVEVAVVAVAAEDVCQSVAMVAWLEVMVVEVMEADMVQALQVMVNIVLLLLHFA